MNEATRIAKIGPAPLRFECVNVSSQEIVECPTCNFCYTYFSLSNSLSVEFQREAENVVCKRTSACS